MTKVVSINFRPNGRNYFFDPGKFELKVGDKVIVETKMGKELGVVKNAGKMIDETKMKDPLKKVIKVANEKDIKHQEENDKEAQKAFDICKKKIKEYKLPMDLVEARYLFDNSKLIFYFTADNRVDFRDLVKDLASIFKTRIELRQISTRDEVKRLGGFGVCGRELCCCTYLKDYGNSSIKLAKEQNLSLNASKITGNCGRLMCCLRYEKNVYEEKLKKLPAPDSIVETPDGKGTVASVEVLKEIIKVKLTDEEGNNYFNKYNVDDIKVLKSSKKTNESKASKEEIQELEKLEKMDKFEKNNSSDDDDV